MFQNVNTQNIKTENVNLNLILSKDTKSFIMTKNQNIRVNNLGKEKCLLNYQDINDEIQEIPKKRQRTDSVDLYKCRRNNEKKKTLNRGDSNNSIKYNVLKLNDSHHSNDITESNQEKLLKNGKSKKVSFLTPNFVTIIDVESYKKYNEENTSKDPFEDLEFLKKLNNINNLNINININNNTNNNNEKDIDDGKERVNCTCTIF